MDASTESNPQTIEVLLVEDNPYDAELILRALRKTGLIHDVIWLKDGVAALEQLFGLKADAFLPGGLPAKLVLLDLKLPKVDGQEVLRRIKTDPRTRSISVVVLTSSCDESDVWRAYDAGANSYIVKPVDFDRLTEVVRQLGLYWLTVNQPPARPVPVRDEAI